MHTLAYAIVLLLACLSAPLGAADPADAAAPTDPTTCEPYTLSQTPPYVTPHPECLGSGEP